MLSQRIRKFNFVSHITFSIGWLGAVSAFIALALTAVLSQKIETVRAACISMELVGWYVILPLCIASFISGLIQVLGTPWGLFKYYWITVKFVLTLGATFLLILHMKPITHIAEVAITQPLPTEEIKGLSVDLSIKAAAALFLLLAIVAISVYKPWGMTPYGVAKHTNGTVTINRSTARKYLLIGGGILLLIIIIKHIVGGRMAHH